MSSDNRIILEVSPSSLDSYASCIRKWKYSSIDGYAPHMKDEKMDLGSLMHSILEAYYKAILEGKDKGTAYDLAYAAGEDAAIKTDLEIPATRIVFDVFHGYHNHYINDGWEPAFVEQPLYFVLFENDNIRIMGKGKLDLGIRNREGGVSIVDHKTGDKYYPPLQMTTQFMFYCIGTGTTELIKNFVGWQKDASLRYKRGIVSYNQHVLDEYKGWMIYTALKMYESVQTKVFPPNLTKCFKCHFQSICSAPIDAREWKLNVNFKRREDFDLFAGSGKEEENHG